MEHFPLQLGCADAHHILERAELVDGGLDSGRLGGICCLEFLSVRGFGPALKLRESECIYRYANLLLPIRVRLPQCSLVLDPRLPTHPRLSLGGDETSYSYLPPDF